MAERNEHTSDRVASIAGQAQNISARQIFLRVLNGGMPAAEEIATMLHSLAGSAATQARDHEDPEPLPSAIPPDP